MELGDIVSWHILQTGVAAGIGAFCGAFLRGWGQRLATRGLIRQVELIKQEVQRQAVRSDKLRFLIESLNERLDEARDNMVRHYERRPVAPGYILNGETIAVTDIDRTLRLHEIELEDFYALLKRKRDLVAIHIWPQDQPREIFEKNVAECDGITREIATLVSKRYESPRRDV